jgi:hypothetical protein
MPITIIDAAKTRGLVESPDGLITAGALAEVGFPILGGCAKCEASIAAYNAYPGRGGFWLCGDCVGDDGFETAENFERWCEEQEEGG